ncbi:2,5-diamino-6-(ribosylamino)-4(3H)-pyrimidinone 5'-phosphate reductase [Chloroflexota bacterium]
MSNLPVVTLNVAMSLDGKTDTFQRKGALISSDLDIDRVDRLRASNDAIMVGGRTILGDDPRLTIKTQSFRNERVAKGLAQNPIKIGIITNADLDSECRFLNFGPAQIIIFTTNRTRAEKIRELIKMGVKVYVQNSPRVDLIQAMEEIGYLGIKSILLEGGGTLNEEMIKSNLVNEIMVYIAPIVLGGASAPTFASSVGFVRDKAQNLKLMSIRQYEDDGLVLDYRIDNKRE